jgi:hypothetical protein
MGLSLGCADFHRAPRGGYRAEGSRGGRRRTAEDLVCKAGPDFIDRIEREAKVNRRFGYLLTGVWPTDAAPEIRDRVLKFCRAFPDPMDGTYRF